MILYRLQNVNSLSPYEIDLMYYGENIVRVLSNMFESHDINKPLFYNDLSNNDLNNFHNFRSYDLSKIRYHYFTSMDTLRNWYGHWLDFLTFNGFSIRAFEVPNERLFVNNSGHACVST